MYVFIRWSSCFLLYHKANSVDKVKLFDGLHTATVQVKRDYSCGDELDHVYKGYTYWLKIDDEDEYTGIGDNYVLGVDR